MFHPCVWHLPWHFPPHIIVGHHSFKDLALAVVCIQMFMNIRACKWSGIFRNHNLLYTMISHCAHVYTANSMNYVRTTYVRMHTHKSLQVYKYTSTQGHKYTNTQVYKDRSIKVYRIQVCTYVRIIFHYITLHCIYITLHYTSLHYITLHWTGLHYIALHLHHTTLHYVPLHYITHIYRYAQSHDVLNPYTGCLSGRAAWRLVQRSVRWGEMIQTESTDMAGLVSAWVPEIAIEIHWNRRKMMMMMTMTMMMMMMMMMIYIYIHRCCMNLHDTYSNVFSRGSKLWQCDSSWEDWVSQWFIDESPRVFWIHGVPVSPT